MQQIPRPEHPRPDLRRDDRWWLNLNGRWQFEIDPGVSGQERGYRSGRELDSHIIVPFCPESGLSGVAETDFLNSVWYRRFFSVPDSWNGRRVLLHVGACDYAATVWLNGRKVAEHEGGYTPFTADLTDRLDGDGRDELVIRAVDPIRNDRIPRGKQCPSYHSHGCLYTRTTGIWQTVWLEAVPATHVRSLRVLPDLRRGAFSVLVDIASGERYSGSVRALADGEPVASAELGGAGAGASWVELKLNETRPWSPSDPFLYRIEVELEGEGGRDVVVTWGGLREFRTEGRRFLLNGEPVFLRTVLDQGFYPDGIYTAPSKDALEGDVEAAMELGFDGARLHQKVFEPLFLHHCDRKGYLVWGEFPDWGHPLDEPAFVHAMLDQWTEVLLRDMGHPALIGWCPLNESGEADRAPWGEWLTRRLYRLTKTLDPTRPVIDASGWFHFVTDVWDTHNYEQAPDAFAAAFEPLSRGDYGAAHNVVDRQLPYRGRRPYFVSEFGGMGWPPQGNGAEGWGYGNAPGSEEEFMGRLRALVGALLENPGVAGFCYTQLTDVEQEINGLMYYDRRPKFAPDAVAEILRQEAALP